MAMKSIYDWSSPWVNQREYTWAPNVNQNDLNQFRASGAGTGATYADFQNWQSKQNLAQQDAQRQQTLSQLTAQADPFASQRGQYQTQLRDLLTNPSTALESNPFFKASSEAGQEAAMRRLRQMGMGTSGNAALELQKQAQANMSDDFFKLSDLLGQFSGAGVNPASALGAAASATNMLDAGRRADQQNAPTFSTRSVSYGLPNYTGLSSYWGQ